MQCKAFTLRLGETSDLEHLNAFLAQVVPLQVSSSLVPGHPAFWSVLVFYEGQPEPTPKAKKPATPPEKTFQTSNPAAFEALRQWRSSRAREENVPPYVIATNSELEAIIQANPKTLEQLEAIPGFSKLKREKYGREILERLKR